MKNPGIILELQDKRKVIVYDKQPLLKEKSKVVMNLIDDSYNLIKDEKGNPKIIIKDLAQYNLENQHEMNKLIGHVD